MSDAQADIEDAAHLGATSQRPVDALTVNNKDLAPLMARAASVVPRNSAVPVLGHVLLQSSPTTLTVMANNMEMALRQSCPARGPTCSFCVDATSLNALLHRLPGSAEVRMEVGDRHVTLRSGPVRAKLATIPVNEFPVFRNLTYAATVKIHGPELRLAFERVRGFIDHEPSRYYLSGTNIRPVPGGLRIEGTNGKCLGASTIEGPELLTMIIPMRSVDEVLKILGDDPVQVSGCPVGAEFSAQGITFTTKLIDANYPDIDRVLPKVDDTRVWRVNRDAMLRAIATASAIGSAASIGDLALSETACRIGVAEQDNKLKRDDQTIVELDETTCSFSGDACAFRIRLSELTTIIKAAGPVCEFRTNADLSWFRINDVADPRATFVVGCYR